MIIPLAGGFEHDALTRARHVYKYLDRAGVRAKAKRQYDKRLRKYLKGAVE